jgi:hypothetical protein
MWSTAIAANFILIKYKWDHNRYVDLVWDISILIILVRIFEGGGGKAMASALMGGAFISLYLLYSTKGPDVKS